MKAADFTLQAGRLAAALLLALALARAADSAAPALSPTELKARLEHAEEKLEFVLRGFSLANEENTTLKSQIGEATTARDAAVAEAAAARAGVKAAEDALKRATDEAAALRASMATRDSENSRLHLILRQAQDTNAALSAEIARLKMALARSGSPARNP